MSKIRLHGSSSGYTEIAPVAASGNNTLTLPNDGTIISKDAAGAIGVTSVHTTNITTTGIATITTAKIGAGVTISESGIEASGIGITCANINGTQIGGRRRLNMNGEFQVWQRSTSESSLGGSNGYFTADRWRISGTGSQRYTMSRSTDTPTGQGFGYSMKIDCTTTNDFSSAGDYMFFHYRFEGQDLQMIEKGTANAKPVVVSFWIKSPKTGVHNLEMADEDNSRFNSQRFTVSSANTWEKHVVVFPGDTTGAFVNDTSKCCYFAFWGGAGATYSGGSYTSSWHATQNQRAVGQVNIFDNASNDFYMTGFQVEVGDTPTTFEHRSYDEEFKLCQRYYQDWKDWTHPAGRGLDSNYDGHIIIDTLRIDMRANPTITSTSYGWIADGNSWTDGSNSEAASLHHDPSSDFPGRYVKITGAHNWDTNYNNTVAVKLVTATFDAEL